MKMNLSFNGDFSDLKERLSELGGQWDEKDRERKIMRLDGGVLSWHELTGKILFQGKGEGKFFLEENVHRLLTEEESKLGIKARIADLIKAISVGMYEREEIVAVALLGALCGQNTFLYGPPGTAKSLISRRIACAFSEPAYFEYLMNRFSTPEDVFGPISIKELKEDKYVRKTDHYLPKAEFAFLDEIWKSSPAILNTLLTLINERIFRNGENIEQAHLKALIAASNETPEQNQGLEALFDRFIVRLMVGPISETENFEHLLNSAPTSSNVEIDESLRVTRSEWVGWKKEINEVKLSAETLTIIHLIRNDLAEQYDELQVYVSDRRWQRAAILLKAAAFFNDRSETNHSDALLLEHCLWTNSDNRSEISEIVQNAVLEMGFSSDIDLADLDQEKDKLDKEIHQELFFSSDVYETVEIGDEDFFKCKANLKNRHNQNFEREFYIDAENMMTTELFYPCDKNGNTLEDFDCKFDGQGACRITYRRDTDYKCDFRPAILFHKGDKKPNVNVRLVEALENSVTEIRERLVLTLKSVEKREKSYLKKLQSPFVTEKKIKVAVLAISEHIDRLKLRIMDCERLEELCK
jgi:MoxR-like ATPase